MEDKEVLLPIK